MEMGESPRFEKKYFIFNMMYLFTITNLMQSNNATCSLTVKVTLAFIFMKKDAFLSTPTILVLFLIFSLTPRMDPMPFV
jgi:hypothetical protein